MNDVKLLKEARYLLLKSGFSVSQSELDSMTINDFGLNNLREEGVALIDILRSDRLRISILILLPNQTLPQHKHPSYDNERGKEETIRCLWGTFKVYVEGDQNCQNILIPKGKDDFYTARKEILLNAGEQYSVEPGIIHWFQAGDKGAVALAFQNRVNEDYNIFYDPLSTGCPIPKEDIGSNNKLL